MQELSVQVHQFFYSLLAIPRAWRFMWHYKLWRGLRDYGWVAKGLMIVGILVGLYVVVDIIDWLDRASSNVGQMSLLWGENSLMGRLGDDVMRLLTDGSMKWVILVLMEVVIYHFMRESIKVVLGKDIPDANTFKPFFNAQKRMIGVAFTAWIIELLITKVAFGVAFGILPFLDFLRQPLTLIVQAYLLGFAIVDNYSEQFDISIEQSLSYVRRGYMGVCLGLGIPLFLILYIPVIGTFVGPLLMSVTAAIVLRELSDLHLVGYIPSEKEMKKMEKKEAKRRRKAEKKARKNTSPSVPLRRRGMTQHFSKPSVLGFKLYPLKKEYHLKLELLPARLPSPPERGWGRGSLTHTP
ncbi:MAG: hypothetical protein AAF741_19620 [Bacteroidota bacterium]